MFIRSERLFLRPGWAEDWQELYHSFADEGIVRNLETAPWPYRPQDARDFMDRMRASALPDFFVTLPSAAGAPLIGGVGLHRDGNEIELGYWIARPYWGHGYATEAVGAVLSVARAIGHRRIVSSHFHDNPASGRVLEKTGFCRTGRRLGRFSSSRGENVPSIEFAIHLGEGGGFDGGNGFDGDDAAPRMAA